ncbi:YtxH domain-containing protein [Spirosoma soli]|uniref:YtxH domain-containing protein n=1 Tax=Spirosoma soli TaxID=1770529 RepID=A0ABW5MB27_9BACT
MKGFLTGLATGLAVGYLTAPRSGKETRDQLSSTVDKQSKGLKDQWSKASEQVTNLVNDVKSRVSVSKSESNTSNTQTEGISNQYPSQTTTDIDPVIGRYNNELDYSADFSQSDIDRTGETIRL